MRGFIVFLLLAVSSQTAFAMAVTGTNSLTCLETDNDCLRLRDSSKLDDCEDDSSVAGDDESGDDCDDDSGAAENSSDDDDESGEAEDDPDEDCDEENGDDDSDSDSHATKTKTVTVTATPTRGTTTITLSYDPSQSEITLPAETRTISPKQAAKIISKAMARASSTSKNILTASVTPTAGSENY